MYHGTVPVLSTYLWNSQKSCKSIVSAFASLLLTCWETCLFSCAYVIELRCKFFSIIMVSHNYMLIVHCNVLFKKEMDSI